MHMLYWRCMELRVNNCKPDAIACIHGEKGSALHGTVRFWKTGEGVMIEAEICGLPQSQTGFFALHIHEGTSCCGEGFSDTGGHYNPEGKSHPNHAGDLPPLMCVCGRAYMQVLTGRFTLREVIGKTVVIHSGPDDFHTQPAGNAGTKIGCGVICSR